MSARHPVVLGIAVYDPLRPHTHYLRRKAPVDALREIHLQLPVTPANLLVSLYDKNSPTDESFRVEKFKVSSMEEPSVWATPERHRFMDFAIRFAQKAGFADPGFYHSNGYEYLIHYLPIITGDDGKELVTPARIHRRMPRVQLSQRLFKQFSVPVRVAILAHEGCHYFNDTRSEKEADLCGIRYYLDFGFPTIEGIYAATQVFLRHPDTVGQTHVRRAHEIGEFIEQYHKKKQNLNTHEG